MTEASRVVPRTWTDGDRPLVGTPEEPIFFLVADGEYRGSLPAFYDPGRIAAVPQLEAAFERIRAEVTALIDRRPEAFRPNFTPNAYSNAAFRTLNLSTDGRAYHRARELLPVTAAVCDGLPGFSSAQVGILEPGCELAEHTGDTNVMYRLHLPLVVPGTLPDLGLSAADHHAGWAEGEVLVFEDAHRHRVWNHTDRPRVILLVDVVKDELCARAPWLRAQAGAGILLQIAIWKVPLLERWPRWARRLLLDLLALPVLVAGPIQRAPRGWIPSPLRRSTR